MSEPNQVDPSTAAVETARRIFRGAAERMVAQGVAIDDVAIGMAYACQDVAAVNLGDHHQAIGWLRTCTDLQERQLLEREARRH